MENKNTHKIGIYIVSLAWRLDKKRGGDQFYMKQDLLTKGERSSILQDIYLLFISYLMICL